MFSFTTDYFLLVAVSTLGVIQLAASIGGLRGLLIFKSPILARGLGIALVVAAFVWFFGTEFRNVNDYEGGLDANTQALFFFLGVLTGGVVTFLGSSLVNARMGVNSPMRAGGSEQLAGFDTLKESSYLRALATSLGYWRRNWRRQIKHYFFG